MVEAISTDSASSHLREAHALAVAFARYVQAKIVVIVDDSKTLFNPYTRDNVPLVTHVFALSADDQFIDPSGIFDRETIEARVMRGNEPVSMRMIVLSGEEALSAFISSDWDYSLSPLTDDLIEASRAIVESVVARFMR